MSLTRVSGRRWTEDLGDLLKSKYHISCVPTCTFISDSWVRSVFRHRQLGQCAMNNQAGCESSLQKSVSRTHADDVYNNQHVLSTSLRFRGWQWISCSFSAQQLREKMWLKPKPRASERIRKRGGNFSLFRQSATDYEIDFLKSLT